MKDGVYYDPTTLDMRDIFIYRNVDLVMIRRPDLFFHLDKESARAYLKDYKFLGEL